MITRAERTSYFFWTYGTAVLLCWATQAVFFGISGRRGSLLAFGLLPLEELLRVSLNRMSGREIIEYLPPPYAISVFAAAIVAALPLAAAFTLTWAENRAVRWIGYLVLAVLAFLGLYWPLVPNNIF